MSMRSEYEEYKARQAKLLENPMSRYWINQESRYVKPFQMYGNLWYVGDSWVCAHVVDTGHGLLLFDAGNCGNRSDSHADQRNLGSRFSSVRCKVAGFISRSCRPHWCREFLPADVRY